MIKTFSGIALWCMGLMMSSVVLHARAADWSTPGPFLIGSRSVSITRADNTTFTAQVYYPAVAPGANHAFAASAAPAPAISFGHGFFQPVSRYLSTLQHLASHGYIVIASESEGGLAPSHARFASDLSRCLTYLEQQNALSGSWLVGSVNVSAFAMSGHSMGGGCSILAASTDARIRALAPMAPAETNPTALGAAPNLGMPTMIVVGDADSIVPTAANGLAMYNAIDTPRQLANIRGGFHCGFIDTTTFGCDSSSLPRADQLQTTRRLLTAWFALYLKGDQSAWPVIWGNAVPIDSRTQVTKDARATTSPADASYTLPVGTASTLCLTVRNTDEQPAEFRLLSESDNPTPWPVSFDPAGAFSLAPGTQTVIYTTVTARQGSTVLIVSAQNTADRGTRAWSRLSLTGICAADFNNDGGVDGSDVAAFFESWEAGAPAADVDANGGVDGGDVEFFFGVWSAGGC